MLRAAKQSKYDARHWFIYLRKVIFDNSSYLTENDFMALWKSDELTAFQKVTLKYAMKTGSPTHQYVVSLNKPAKLTKFNRFMEKTKNEQHESSL